MQTRRFASFFFAASLSACNVEGSGADRTARASDPIVNGVASDASEDEVVLILTHVPSMDTAQGAYYRNCTGTLIAPNLVLTARHCISAVPEATFTCNEDGTVASGTGASIGADYVPSDTHIFVGATLPDTIDPTMFPGQGEAYVHDAATVVCNDDLALIVLAAPIPNAKIAPIRLDGGVTKGETFTAVGWGTTVTDFVPPVRQKRDGVQVLLVGPSTTPYFGSELGDREFRVSESVCTGDSGGPALDSTTGAVIGTVSNGPNGGDTMNGAGCVGTTHTFQSTSGYKDVIMQGFAMAGATPWIEGRPMPGGGGGGGGSGSTSSSTGSGAKPKPKTTSSGCSVASDASASGIVVILPLALALGLRRRRRAG